MNTFKKLFAFTAIFALLATLMPVQGVNAASYSSELEGAYDYAYDNGITTMDSIDNANMYGSLTRVAMAKMMANYAMDVLGLEKDTDMECTFPDVSSELDAQYDNGVTNACQLGLMGVGVDNFDPYGLVNRAQFGTVLSRALWGDMYNDSDPYYADHLEALADEGIMNNISNPMMLEVRGYVMLMMQRADEDSTSEGCSAEELLACITAEDYDDCIAECSGEEEEEEEEVYVEEKEGTLTVDLDSGTPDGDLPIGNTEAISRVPLLTFEVEADDADITLHNLTLEFLGYGDFNDLDNVSVYDENNVKVSKTKNFTDEELTIGFVNDYVVKDGGKETLTIVWELDTAAEPNTTYGVSIMEMDTSAEEVDWLPIDGEKMKGVVVTNQTVLDFEDGIAVTDTVDVGEEAKLAGFTLENDENFEDVTVNSITIKVDGVKTDILDNLSFLIDGQDATDGIELNDDEIVVNVDYMLEKESNAIEFELRGSFNELDDDDAEFTIEDAEAIYVVGNKYYFNVTSDVVDDTAIGTITIQGSEISSSFDKSDIDEAKPEASDVFVGTLKLKSANTDYTINSYSICVDTSGLTNGDDDIKDLTLWGNSYDDETDDGCGAGLDEYIFEDIDLPAGEQVNLQLVVDFEDTVAEDDEVDFDVSLDNEIDVTDEDNDEDYDETTAGDIFSTVSWTAKTITIKWPTFDMTTTSLNDRTVVLGTQEELVYKAKINIGDADDVTLKSININNEAAATIDDITDVIQSATLYIDGSAYEDTSIETERIKFTNINHEFDASESNVVVELVIKLKTDDLGWVDKTLIFSTAEADVTLKDSENDDLDAGNVTLDDDEESCTMTLTEEGELTVSYVVDDDDASTTMNMFTEQDKFVLAGDEEKALLAKMKFKADREDIKVEAVTFTFDDVDGDFYNSYEDFYFMLEDAEEAIGSVVVTYNDADVTTLEYSFPSSSNFEVSKLENTYAYLYVTTKAHDEDENAAEAGSIDGASVENLEVDSVEFKGLSSDLDENDLDLTISDAEAGDGYDTYVEVNTIASVELVEVLKTLTVGTHVIGEIVVTPTEQDRNLDDEGDVLNAYIGSLNLDWAASDCTVTSVSIRRVGETTTVALTDNTATDISALWADAEIDWTVTYELVAVLSAATAGDAAIQLLIDDVTTDVVFASMDPASATWGSDDLFYLLPSGVSKEQVVSTK
jgi:hypothetical protein